MLFYGLGRDNVLILDILLFLYSASRPGFKIGGDHRTVLNQFEKTRVSDYGRWCDGTRRSASGLKIECQSVTVPVPTERA